MTPAEIFSLAIACAPTVAPSTIQSFVKVESGGNHLAIGVVGDHLTRQPRTKEEAIEWSRWMLAHGYNISVGVMQINYKNWSKYGLTLDNVFEPCTNMSAGGKLITETYNRAAKQYGPGQRALLATISAYNTGNFKDGFTNGYVGLVTAAAGLVTAPDKAAPPLSQLRNRQHPAPGNPPSAVIAATDRAPSPSSLEPDWSNPTVWGPDATTRINPFASTAQESSK